MANQLKMATIDTIVALHRRQWSIRRIAAALGIHRDTVARHLRQVKQAGAPAGSTEALPVTLTEGFPAAKQAGAPTGSTSAPASCPHQQPSLCEPWRALILGKLEQGLSAQRIYQDLVSEHGFAGKYPSVRRFVGRLGADRVVPCRRMECAPGEEAQVDFGSGAPVVLPDGQRRRTHVFRIALSHSRKAYSEAIYRQTTDSFLLCLENAFAHFGGVPRTLIPDNLKAAVLQPDWYDPELNPKLRSFAEHYGLAILPCRPATPRHKGKIENGVGYVKDNALKGHVFASLEEQNRHLLAWETTVADTRIHGTTRRQVGKVFTEVERPALLPLPRERFPCFHEARRTVHRDGHVEVARAYYSVPPEYLGRPVWVRWDGRLLRVFNERWQQIAVHVQHEPGRFSTQAQHIVAEKVSAVERGAAWLLGQVRRLGPQSTRWAEAVIAARGVEGIRVLQGLLSLAKRHPAEAIERACAIAAGYGCHRLRTVRRLIDRQAPTQEQFAFMHEHPLIRPLAEYTQFVHAAFQQEGSS
ncbi:MAG TPA: IS21 family transposase [Castellaniella sp.]|nr:IS21 family transposase [Castellaniella sp.]